MRPISLRRAPIIPMVQSAKSGLRDYFTRVSRLYGTRHWAVVLKPLVRPRLMIIHQICSKNTPKMLFVENNRGKDALSTKVSDRSVPNWLDSGRIPQKLYRPL